MKISKTDNNAVIIDYGDNVAVKYVFNDRSKIENIKRNFPRIMTVAEENAEAKLARCFSKINSRELVIEKKSALNIELREVGSDDSSIVTEFNFATRNVERISYDNNVGADNIKKDPALDFSDYIHANDDRKIQFVIIKEAMKLLK